jgi:hypothetical protein
MRVPEAGLAALENRKVLFIPDSSHYTDVTIPGLHVSVTVVMY